MWSIFDDIHIRREILNLKQVMRKNSMKSKKFPKFVFICGQKILDDNGNIMDEKILCKNRRYCMMNKFNTFYKSIEPKTWYTNLVCIISEKLYDSNSPIDLLTFEELLAEVSDNIIIFIESEGTMCELGAFSIENSIVEKLYVINDLDYREDKSFINDGPIAKIKGINENNVTYIKNDLDEFKKKLNKNVLIKDIYKTDLEFKPNLDSSKIKVKYCIYELINIMEIFQPITQDELIDLYKYLKGFKVYTIEDGGKKGIKTLEGIIKLMKDMELIICNGEFLEVKPNITCYNALFTIDRTSLNSIRVKILSRIYKNDPKRMVINDECTQSN